MAFHHWEGHGMTATTLVPDMHPRARTTRWPALLVRMSAVLLALLVGFPAFALADEVYEPPPLAPGSNAVGSCLAADQVWLFVADADGVVLANQCVGTPASGEEALARGGMQIRFSTGRLICSLSGHPEQCAATFTGSYWNYYHGKAGAQYTYSKEGAASRRPSPGDIEAWCYNGPDEKSCIPPLLTITSAEQRIPVPGADTADYVDPAPTTNEAVPVPASTPWALIGTGAIIVVGIAALLWWRRRTGPADDRVGGR